MKTLKARVRKGRLVLDEPTSLPEGTEVELVPAKRAPRRRPANRRGRQPARKKGKRGGPYARTLALRGQFHSDHTNVSENVDAHLADVLYAEKTGREETE